MGTLGTDDTLTKKKAIAFISSKLINQQMNINFRRSIKN